MDARYSFRCFIWSVLILVLVSLFFDCSTVAADISLTELGFIAYRQRIQKLDIVVENENLHPPTGKVTKSRQRLTQDGNRRRSDVDYEQFDMAGGGVLPKMRRGGFVSLGLCFVLGQELPTDLGKNEARFNFATPEATKSDFPFFPIDGRLLGVSPAATSRLRTDRPMDSTIASPNRQGPTEIVHEDDRTVVRFKKKSGSAIELGFKKHGECDLLILAKIEGKAGKLTMSCSHVQESRSKLWFPDKIEVIHTEGEKTIDHDVTRVTVNSLNEVIDPGLFTLESLSLPPGTPISGTAVPAGLIEDGFHVEWDGGKLAKVKNISLEESLRLKQLKE
jgi:hypothetical protein